ncbi:MAG: F0F1 ATP synthase subunit A [Thermodesulfobacteriota bacterium]|nr:F0F1 ATP synthase subunit A [Thermodesulfobacteriota bacterium]
MTWCLIILFLVLFSIASRRFRVIPGKLQAFFEYFFIFIDGLMADTIGEERRKFVPLVGTLALFILSSNLLGLVPGFLSPTSSLNTTVACAFTVFFYYNYIGIKTHGFKYLKKFIGPNIYIAPIMFPIEVISHLSRPLSLSVRLFGNIMGEDLILVILFSLVPYLVPLPMMFMAIFTSVIQTFIFTLLTIMYIAGALEEEH